MSKRIEWVDIFKAIAVLWVVVGHSSSPVNGYIYLFHVPAFFFISGFTTDLDKSNLKTYAVRRLQSLILPFVCLNVFFILIRFSVTQLGFSNVFFASPMTWTSVPDAIWGIFLYANAFDLGGATWFLVVLFEASLLSKIVYDILGLGTRWGVSRTARIWGLFLISVVLLLLGYKLYRQGIQYRYFLDLSFAVLFYFVLGIIFREYRLLERQNWIFFIPLSIGCMYYYTNVRWAPMNWPTRSFDAWPINNILSTLAGVYLTYVISVALTRVNWLKPVFTYMGVRTISIFALHFLTFRIVYAFLYLLGLVPIGQLKELVLPSGNGYWYIVAILSVILVLLIDYGIGKSSWLSFLLLGKSINRNQVAQDHNNTSPLSEIGVSWDMHKVFKYVLNRLPVLLLCVLIVLSVIDLDNLGVYPDELLDAQNAIAILSQQNMHTQVIEYNKLSLGGMQFPIYGIKPYNGASLSYVLALGFAILGISITSLKLITLLLMTISVIVLYKVLSVIANRYLALLAVALFALDPYFLHFIRYDHGPLRLYFLLFCLFIWFLIRSIYGHSLAEWQKLLWVFVAGLGLYSHVIFIVPLFAFAIAFVMLPDFRRLVIPKHWPIALFIFVFAMLPFLFDISGLVKGYGKLVYEVATSSNVSIAGGRSASSGSELASEVVARFQQYIWGRNQSAFLFEFQAYPHLSISGWGLFTIGLILVGTSFSLWILIKRRRITEEFLTRSDLSVILISVTMLGLCLTLPLIGSLHHQIYGQVALTLVAVLLVGRLLAQVQSRKMLLGIVLFLSVLSVLLNFLSVSEYVYVAHTKGPSGLLSPSVRDMEYIIGTKYKTKDLITYGFGMDIYVALLFDGKRASQIYIDPRQINTGTALFTALGSDGKIQPFKRSGSEMTLAEFAGKHGLQLDEVTISSDKGGYPAFAVITFKVPPPTDETIQVLAGQIHFMLKRIQEWRDSGNDYRNLGNQRAIADGLVPSSMIVGPQSIVNPWSGITIEGSPDGESFYLLYSGVPTDYCAKLAMILQTEGIIAYAGNYGKEPMDELQAKDFCTTGNMWFLPK